MRTLWAAILLVHAPVAMSFAFPGWFEKNYIPGKQAADAMQQMKALQNATITRIEAELGMPKGAWQSLQPSGGCTALLSGLDVLDIGPAAWGTARATWRAAWHGKEVAVKKPLPCESRKGENDGRPCNHPLDNKVIFTGSAMREAYVLSDFFKHGKLRAHPYIMVNHGICLDWTLGPFAIADGGLVGLAAFLPPPMRLVNQTLSWSLPWCVVLRLAYEIASVCAFFTEHDLLHCDWGAHQMAVDAEGHFKLVDVKSVRRMFTNECRNDRDCDSWPRHKSGAVDRQVSHPCLLEDSGSMASPEFMPASNLRLLTSCNRTTHQCPPIDTSAMVWITSTQIFAPLFHTIPQVLPAFRAAQTLLRRMGYTTAPASQRNFERKDWFRVVAFLNSTMRSLDAGRCLQDTRVEVVTLINRTRSLRAAAHAADRPKGYRAPQAFGAIDAPFSSYRVSAP